MTTEDLNLLLENIKTAAQQCANPFPFKESESNILAWYKNHKLLMDLYYQAGQLCEKSDNPLRAYEFYFKALSIGYHPLVIKRLGLGKVKKITPIPIKIPEKDNEQLFLLAWKNFCSKDKHGPQYALYIFKILAEKRYLPAILSLWLYYKTSNSIPPSTLFISLKEAAQNNSLARLFYTNEMFNEKKINRNVARALLENRAHDQMRAPYYIALQILPKFSPKNKHTYLFTMPQKGDLQAAIKWLERGFAAGDTRCAAILGRIYLETGVRNDDKAIEYLYYAQNEMRQYINFKNILPSTIRGEYFLTRITFGEVRNELFFKNPIEVIKCINDDNLITAQEKLTQFIKLQPTISQLDIKKPNNIEFFNYFGLSLLELVNQFNDHDVEQMKLIIQCFKLVPKISIARVKALEALIDESYFTASNAAAGFRAAYGYYLELMKLDLKKIGLNLNTADHLKEANLINLHQSYGRQLDNLNKPKTENEINLISHYKLFDVKNNLEKAYFAGLRPRFK